jgi:hypothetical protein
MCFVSLSVKETSLLYGKVLRFRTCTLGAVARDLHVFTIAEKMERLLRATISTRCRFLRSRKVPIPQPAAIGLHSLALCLSVAICTPWRDDLLTVTHPQRPVFHLSLFLLTCVGRRRTEGNVAKPRRRQSQHEIASRPHLVNSSTLA